MSIQPKILLTGASGRVARAIREGLRPLWDIRSFSRSQFPTFHRPEELTSDRSNWDAEALIHTAWSVLPVTAETHPKAHRSVDLPILERVIASFRNAPRPPLIVFLSTAAVYGPARKNLFVEQDKPAPIGAYARGKFEAEEMLRKSGLPVCILRIGNLYGLPANPDDVQGVIPRLIRIAGSDTPLSLWGGDTEKDYLHRDDFLSALTATISQRLEGTWNLGSGESTRLLKIIETVQRLMGQPINVEEGPGNSWDVKKARIDISAFREATGWAPKIMIEEGLAREIRSITKTRLI
jgi:UDP-glucose 4-epimerase